MRLKVGEPTERDIGADSLRGLAFEGPRLPAVAYKGTKLGCGCGSRVRGSLDVVVEGKASDWDRPLTLPSPRRGEGSGLRLPLPRGERAGVRGITRCLRLGGFEVGLLINSHVAVLKQGLRRKVL